MHGTSWGGNHVILLFENGDMTILYSNGSYSTLDTGVTKVVSQGDGLFYEKLIDGQKKYFMNVRNSKEGFFLNSFPFINTYNTPIDCTDYLSNYMDVSKIKDFTFENGLFILLDDGDLCYAGNQVYAGNKQTSYTEGFINLTRDRNIRKVTNFIESTNIGGYRNISSFLIKCEDGKYYSTYNQTIMYKDDILEKSWKKINPDGVKVKKMNASTCGDTLGFIDENNDLWVLGNDVRELGINHENDDMDIPNFIRIKDYLEELDIYNNINGKVVDYAFGMHTLYIVTNDEDNNTLYSTGRKTMETWPYNTYNGLNKDNFIPTKVMDNVKLFSDDQAGGTMVMQKDGTLWCWGCGDGYASPYTGATPNKYSSHPNQPNEVTEVGVKFMLQADCACYLYLNNNKLYGCGLFRYPDCSFGLELSTNIMHYIDNSYFNNETLKKISRINGNVTYYLSTDGNLYGSGAKNKLGIGTSNTDQSGTPISLKQNGDIDDVVSGNAWTVYVTKDGRVYGTGSNLYGILGRWIGIDRNSPNSRYKTAFDWVECPELEI